jgi:iron(III) transport system permease protein
MSPRSRVPVALLVPAIIGALIALLPIIYLVDVAFDRGLAAVIDELWRERTLRLVVRSVGLTVAVTAAAVVIGTFTAWAVVLSGLRAGTLLLVVFSLSLAIPSYLSGFAWISWFPELSGFVGAFIVLSLVTYPFVMLPVAAAMRSIDPVQDEVARSLGRGPVSAFFAVTLGNVRGALTGGALLVALYTLSDFGAVAAMRYEVFTWVIYGAYRAGFNPARAAILSLVLVALALLLTWGEMRARGATAPSRLGSGLARRQRHHLSPGFSALSIGVSVIVVALGVGVPVVSAVSWLMRDSERGLSTTRLVSSILSSFQIGVFTSLATVLIALPVAITAARYRTPTTRWLERSTYVAHALPGIVIAISVVYIGIRTVPSLYQHIPLLVLAQVIVFLPLATASMRSAVEQSTASVEEVARGLGANTFATLVRVTLPIAMPGILAAAAMTMLSSVKELPTTLLLRPTGVETLATSIWTFSAVSDYAAVGPYAIALIVLSAIPVAVLTATTSRVLRAS